MWLTNNKFAFLKLTTNNNIILNQIKYIILILVFGLQNLHSQNFLSKLWHSSTSHYNYYYNAELIVFEAKESGENTYIDNYKEILSLYAIPDEGSLKGNAAKMDEVLKKCSHIIEKHSKGKWVDDSYLLMGDAHFYKGDFYSALEVYEYVAGTYKGSSAAAQAEINILKTYLQLKKYNDAEALYTKLNSSKTFPAKLRNELNIAGAAVNIYQKKYLVAIKLLEISIPKTKAKINKIRYNFVLGQLYSASKKNPDGNEKFKKVIKLNPPYDFAFHSKLNIAKAINPKNRVEINQAIASLQGMLKDDKNIEYFDQIYYELGNLALLDKNEILAITYYSNALRAKSNDLTLKSSSYMALAELYFKRQDYINAQIYFDSAARSVDKNNPNYEAIITKNNVLNELIKHLVIIKTNDSLLKLSENEKLREKTIDKLIKEDRDREDDKKREDELKRIQQQIMPPPNVGNIVNTTFPFYNMAAKTKGFQDFQRIWGNRELADFWAISSNKSAAWEKIDKEQKNNDFGSEAKNKILADAPAERKKYYENIPFTKDEKQKLKDEAAESYFLGANVYFQSLKEYDKSRKMLDELLKKYPKSKFEINAYYLLAKIYSEKGDLPKVKYYTDLIRQTDSLSNFLAILEKKDNPDSLTKNIAKVDTEVDVLYKNAYTTYKNKDYIKLSELKKENDTKFPGNPLQVNFDYLEALSIAEQGNFKDFEMKLKAINDNYPQTEIGKQAATTLELIKQNKKKTSLTSSIDSTKKYTYDKDASHFYVLVLPKGANMDKLKAGFNEYNKTNYPIDNLQITASLLGKEQILMVNNFSTLEALKNYLKLTNNNISLFDLQKIVFPQSFIISNDNFVILSKDKNISDYLIFFQNNYAL